VTLDASGPVVGVPLTLCSAPLPESDGLQGELTALAAPPHASELVHRTGLLMVSIKNRQFTTDLIDGFCRFATTRLRGGSITIVDRPYVQNILAATSNGAPPDQIEGLRQLADERTRQVRRIMRRYDPQRIELIAWDALAERTPDWITSEILAAWNRRGALYADLITQARRRGGRHADPTALERWALFLVEETPVLLYSYYLAFGAVVDCYPGPLPEYLWRIERGDYATELPRVSALARTHPSLVCADVRC
jgi:hypothetical protein